MSAITYIAVYIDGEAMVPVGLGDSPEAAIADSKAWWRETARLQIAATDNPAKAAEVRAKVEAFRKKMINTPGWTPCQ